MLLSITAFKNAPEIARFRPLSITECYRGRGNGRGKRRGGGVNGMGPARPRAIVASTSLAYTPPFHLTRVLHDATIDVGSEVIRDEEAEMRLVTAPQ